MNRRVIIAVLAILGLWWQLAGCVFKDEELHIADSFVVVKVINNKPKVRVASGFDECKWRGKYHSTTENYEIWLKCKFPLSF